MENEIEIDLVARRKKLLMIMGATLALVGIILLLAPKKRVKPKYPVITPIKKPKVIKKTITITPTEKTEIEEEEIEEEIETPIIEEEEV